MQGHAGAGGGNAGSAPLQVHVSGVDDGQQPGLRRLWHGQRSWLPAGQASPGNGPLVKGAPGTGPSGVCSPAGRERERDTAGGQRGTPTSSSSSSTGPRSAQGLGARGYAANTFRESRLTVCVCVCGGGGGGGGGVTTRGGGGRSGRGVPHLTLQQILIARRGAAPRPRELPGSMSNTAMRWCTRRWWWGACSLGGVLQA